MRRLRPMGAAFLGLTPLAVLLVWWQAVGTDGSPYYPRPSSWWQAVRELWEAGKLAPALTDTVVTVALGLAGAIVVGVILGVLTGLVTPVRESLQPSLEFLRMIPPPALIPAGVLLIGVNVQLSVGMTAFAASWPILLNVNAGAAALPPLLSDVADSLHLTRIGRLRKIMLPALLPSVLIGIRVAAPIAVVVALLLEMLTNSGGLGSLLVSAQRSFSASEAFGLLFVVGILGLLINYMTITLDRRINQQRGQKQS